MITGASVDRYADWGKETLSAVDVFQAGMAGVVRYLSNNPAKNLTPPERDALLAHGMDIRLVWETTETRSTEGSLAGATDGVIAARQALALEYPAGHVIFASSDTDTTWHAVEAYHRAFKTAVEHYGYQWDVYGGYQVCFGAVLSGMSKAPWQTAAWSYGHVVPEAWAVQNNFHLPIGGVDCDGSDVMHPSTPWRAPKPKPKPKPKPVPKPKPKPKPKPPVKGTDVTPEEVATLLKKQQDTIILHIRPQILAEIDAKFADLEAKLAAKGTI
jgi:hypothetical protein